MSITLAPIDYFWLILLVAVVLGLAVFLVRRRRAVEPETLAEIKRQWQGIEDLLKQPGGSSWQVAVMEADKLVDYGFKTLGIPGKDFGERVRFFSYQNSSIRAVWPAHQIRNRLVHEPNFKLDQKTAARAISQFKAALKVMKVL
ncbi:MAG: hypothetical protein WCT37_01385 [Patescibacteria group bacterium]|jgi:hypothetical protein